MKIMILVLAICLFSMGVVPVFSSPEVDGTTLGEKNLVVKTPKMIIDEINAIRKTPNIDGLIRVGQAIDLIPVCQDGDRLAKIDLWLKAIDLLDQIIDPAFNFNDVPRMNVAPPPETGFDPGVAPSAIKNEEARRQYEAAIKANAEKAERYRLQRKARNLAQDWFTGLTTYIGGKFTSDRKVMGEVIRLIETNLSNKARRESLKAKLQSR